MFDKSSKKDHSHRNYTKGGSIERLSLQFGMELFIYSSIAVHFSTCKLESAVFSRTGKKLFFVPTA